MKNWKSLLLLLSVLFRVFAEHEGSIVGKSASMRIIITSGIGNLDRRHACRTTWLKWVKHFKRLLSYTFYVEAPLTEVEHRRMDDEAAVFKDIVLINATAPRDKSLGSCTFRRWEALQHEYHMFGEKVDFYVFADDDSFLCIHHLIFDSKFWPESQRVQLAHFVFTVPDVISIYSSLLVKSALELFSDGTHNAQKTGTLHSLVMDGKLQNVTTINDRRFAFGAMGGGQNRYNEISNGWVGVDLLNSTEKVSICHHVLSLHQVYPANMIDLWGHISTENQPEVYSIPALSRDITGT